MESKDRVRIQKNLKKIVDDLLVQDVIPILIQEGTISLNDSEVIQHEITKRDQAFKLVQIVLTRGPKAYNTFRKSLLEFYEHLVELLDNTDVTAEDLDVLERPGENISDNVLHLIRDELKIQYLGQLYCVNPVPWIECFQVDLEKVYTSLKIVRGVNRAAFQKAVFDEQKYDYTVGTADIFKATEECASPRRILVEGEPGIGKSIMCCKLCYDWAKGRKTPEHSIHKFDLIFIVKARELEVRSSILDIIYGQLLPEDFSVSKKDFKECIMKNAKKTLIIVDGFDELMEQHVDLNKIIQGKILSQVTLLLTSRPGFALNFMKYFDSVFVNIGYDEHRRLEFIDKFSRELNQDNDQQYVEDFKDRLKSDSVLKELCRNPLNLSILCMLVNETELELPKTRTALYEELKKFIIQRASVTLDMSLESLEEKCRPLEVIAYEGIKDGRQQVSETEIKSHCNVTLLQHLGFFCKEVSVSRFKHVTMFSFTHKSFQEYFAARYLARPTRTRQERKEMAGEILQNGSNKLVIVFLCGLLKDKTESLIDILEVLKAEIFLPSVPCEELGIHDANENHRSHVLFHCINEVAPLPSKLGSRTLNVLVDQVSISFPWCSEECIDGLLKFCEICDNYCSYCKLMRDICTSVKDLNFTNLKHSKPNIKGVMNNNNTDYKSHHDTVVTQAKTNFISERPNTLQLNNVIPDHTQSLSLRPSKPSPQMEWAGKHLENPNKTVTRKDVINMNRRKSAQAWLQSQHRVKSKSFDELDEVSPQEKLTPQTEHLAVTYSKRPKSKSNEALMNKNVSGGDVGRITRQNLCHKFSITVPGPFIIERTNVFDKALTQILSCKHVSAFGVHNITSVVQLQLLFKILAKVGRPRMTALKLKFLGGFSDFDKSVKLNPVYFHWIQSLAILECSSPDILEQLIQNIPSANTIRYLTFQYCTFSESGLSALNSKVQNMKTLKKFEFIHNNVKKNDHVSISSLLSALENHAHIGHFAISHLPTRIEKHKDSKLEKLDTIFPKKDETSQYFTPHLCNIIEKNELSTLNISNTDLGDGILKVISDTLEDSRTLDNLELRYCHLINQSMMDKILRNAISKSILKELDLMETELSMENFDLISELLQKTKTLTRFVVSVYNAAAVEILAEGIHSNTTLSELVLSKVIFNETNLEPLATAISRHSKVQILHITSNDMIPHNVPLLFSAIKTANTLHSVTLHNFGFEDIHMIEFAKVLGSSSNISHVDLQKNFIGQTGSDHLYKALCLRDKLLSLNLSDNRAKEYHREVQLLMRRVLYLKVNWF